MSIKLLDKGLIEKFQDSKNKKEKYFRLTNEGKKARETYMAHHDQALNEMRAYLCSLNENDKNTILTFMKMMKQYMPVYTFPCQCGTNQNSCCLAAEDKRIEEKMLELKHISFSVMEETGQQKKILKDINLTIDTDTFVVITGPNGGGKSTLAKIIMGIEKPSQGTILFKGQDITNLDIHERAKLGMGFAFQQPVRFKGLTVRDLLHLSTSKQKK